MNVDDQIKVFRDFIEQNYYPQLLEQVRTGEEFIVLDFAELIKFNTELSEELLENPEELFKAAELAVREFDLPKKLRRFTVRLKNLPASQKIKIHEIRSKHLEKLVWLEGIVRQKSDVRPHVAAAKFECPSCGNILNVIQLDKKYKEPTRCGCGRKGKFKEISKQLVDGQGLVLEESPDELDGAQPKRINIFLKNDLVSPISERKSSPGSKIRVAGWVTEVPITLRTGGQSTKYDLIIEANYVEPLADDTIDMKISAEDLEEIKKISRLENPLHSLATSLAPSIYGHDKIKEAIVMQLAGGVRKVRPDGVTTRGDMHMLFIGDPGCIAGDSLISLYHKGFRQIKDIGKKHMQPLRELVTKIRKGPRDLSYDYTSNFQIYKNQPTLRLLTETGKELVGTYNQPLLTKKGWVRLDRLKIGQEIRVMPKIPNYIKYYKKNGFERVIKKSGKLKKVQLPEKLTPELAALYGYIIGDGNISKRGYTISCYVNEEEKDLIKKLEILWNKLFSVKPKIYVNKKQRIKNLFEKDKNRLFISSMPLHVMEINSKELNNNLSFLAEKRVPQLIFQSPLSVISSFISWLFEADGCCFGKGRGRTSIQLKSSQIKLLKDVQILLLYFGIQSRIIEDNLCIRRSRDMKTFSEKIGFVSKKKKEKLIEVVKHINGKSDQQKRTKPQRWEKIALIEPHKVITVYDFEVPKSKSFIANGIVCHNSGKSQLLKRVAAIAPRARFTSGKGATGSGLCVAPDSLVLTNPGGIEEIKNIVDKNLDKYKQPYKHGVFNSSKPGNTKIFTLNSNLKVKPKKISQLWKIPPSDYMIKITTRTGKVIETTPKTKLFSDKCEWKKSDQYREGDFIATSRHISFKEENKSIFILDIIKSNPVIHNIKNIVNILIEKACKKNHINKRELAKRLKVYENAIYHNWIKERARGNIKLRYLQKLAKLAKVKLKNCLPMKIELSLYNGHNITIPKYINEELLYFAGLIAGDGDLCKNNNSISIRLSSNSKYLLNKFSTIAYNLFSVKTNRSSFASEKRPESRRFSSKIVFEILNYLGIPLSPKSHKLNFSQELLHLPKNKIKYYLQGYFDTDGGCVERTNGGDYIESNSTSKEFSEKLVLLLLRYNIVAKIRKRKPSINKKIKGKYNKYSINLWGKLNLLQFQEKIGFQLPNKREKLARILSKMKSIDTNLDIIPNARNLIKETNNDLKINLLKGRRDNHGISRNYVKKIIKDNPKIKHKSFEKLKLLSKSDILWDKIKTIEQISHEHSYVYDLTVNDSHNFIVNGILVHNTASVVKDEFLGGWSLEAGTLVLANKGFAIIDELDKMTKDDRSALHEALEQQQVSIAKANIQATLRCETTVLAAANPKFGRFDPYDLVANQINLPPALINRFDLIFPVKDVPSREKDEKTASFILSFHKNPEKAVGEIDSSIMRKYFAYIRKNMKPEITDEALNEIKEYYVSMRNSGGAEEGGIKSIPITARQLEGLVRFSEASAKIKLASTVTKEDARKAIELVDYCLNQIAKDSETGKIDIDRLSGRITATQRSSISNLKEIIQTVEEQTGNKIIPIETIIEAATEKNIPKEKVEESLEKLRRSGDIFEPKRGFIQRL